MRYNNIKKKWEAEAHLFRGIVYIDANYIEYGYFRPDPLNIPILYRGEITYLDRKEHCLLPLFWKNSHCCYTFDARSANNMILNSKGCFYYPIEKCYNFSKLNLSPKKVKKPIEIEFKYIKQFTFGLEYETSAGNIPWIDCLNNNLVPLYDGSITGHEYVTFPLTYLDLPIIRDHFNLMEQYTFYDHNCSLHIHFGGFPIEYSMIHRLCNFWYFFQNELQSYIPAWSYYVENYKSNGKAYNKVFPHIRNLKEFYCVYTNNLYDNDRSFYKPNQYDADEQRKWEVHGRYYNMNIMHLISGPDHKTVEFRFLRPTTHYDEIKWYLLVLGAFLNYVIKSTSEDYQSISVEKVIRFTFPEDIAIKLLTEGRKLYHLHKIQINNNDLPGIDTSLKDEYLFKICNFHL